MGAFKLGKMTFGSLFKQPETVKYPFETKPQPKGLKGHIRNEVEACILCGMCDKSCPTDSITVDKSSRIWEINAFSCIQCGYCVTVCPKKCLYMEPDYHPAATAINSDRFEIPEQQKVAKPKTEPKPEPKAEAKTAEPKAAEKEVEKPAVVSAKAPQADAAPETTALKDEQVEHLLSLMSEEASQKAAAALAQ